MFDTHCHLNFQAFEGKVGDIINRAKDVGVDHILVPGTDYKTSVKAIEIANQYEGVYAAVGIHPHHANRIQNLEFRIENENEESRIKKLLTNKKVVAVGEVGLDKHQYESTKYSKYQVSNEFIELQKELLREQIKLALEYDKSLILHNREAINEFLGVLGDVWDVKLENRTVFHCCEPDERLLQFAIDHKIFIGVDGDITYRKDKQEFIKKVPLDLLVLETDSPYLTPEPLRSKPRLQRQQAGLHGGQVNEPKNIPLIGEFISKIINTPIDRSIEQFTINSKRLFLIK